MKNNDLTLKALFFFLLPGLLMVACANADEIDQEIPQPSVFGYYDGPYVLYDGNQARVLTVVPGPGGSVTDEEVVPKARLRQNPLKVYPDGRSPNGNRMDPFHVHLWDFQVETQWDFEQPDQVFTISDIECGFSNTVAILQAREVIDEAYQWVYGDGHLVVNGDMFSRGLDMMAMLWLLYKLDYEAMEAGGKVHIIIGNHEAMNLRGDVRYVEDRYTNWVNGQGMAYEQLFDEHAELGRWLRTKNSIIRIGRNLIVHGGISPEFVERGITPLQANDLVRRDLGRPTAELEGTSEFVFRTWGPHWYRGMVRTREDRRPVLANEIRPMLDHFDVDRFIVGHCKGPEIEKLRENMVVVIDVNHTDNRNSGSSRALLIEQQNGKEVLHAVYDDGSLRNVPVGVAVP